MGIILVGLMIIGLLFGEDPDTSSKTQATEAEKETESAQATEAEKETEQILATTPKAMADAYDANTLAADGQFKDKTIRVTGTIGEISTDLFDNAIIELKSGPKYFLNPQFTLKDSEKDKAIKLKKGQKVTLICVGAGDIAKVPMANDCAVE